MNSINKLSLDITFELFQRGKTSSFKTCLENEYIVTYNLTKTTLFQQNMMKYQNVEKKKKKKKNGNKTTTRRKSRYKKY